MSAIFVTATGTEVGKTFVTAGLIRALRAQGMPATALKPVVSGFTLETVTASDPGQLLAALDEDVTPQTLDRIAPWRFAAPLSPDVAAAREGRELPYADLLAVCRKAVADAAGPLLIEGVGGVMVPLDGRHTVLDWIADLGVPSLLIAGSHLGTISHTLTALVAMAGRGLTPKVVVINDTGGAPMPLDETAAVLARFMPAVPIVTMARGAADHDFAMLAALLR